MKVPLRWLAQYVPLTLSPEVLAHRLTMAGVEVEAIQRTGGDWQEVYIGLVQALTPHPRADRLRLATVDLGDGAPQTVVCGAPNVAVGQKIAFAREGARLIDAHSGERKVLKRATIRGVESAGMVCSERELGLSDAHEGILVLPPDLALGLPLTEALGETIFEIAVTPNRPDLLAILGVAREVAALQAAALQEPPRDYPPAGPPNAQGATVEIEAPDLCPRYLATVVRGLTVGPSPDWLQQRLQSAGQRPINNVVDITNYVMLEYGQPLHAFDLANLRGARIRVRRAQPGEPIHLIDGSEHRLGAEILVIADAERAVAVAGVMGGRDAEVSQSTATILLEAANFSPTNIRRTAAALKTRTEASTRFEKGLSPTLAEVASARATRLLIEICGGVADQGAIDVYPGRQPERALDVSRRRLAQVLGIDLPVPQVRDALTRLGFHAEWSEPDLYRVDVPYWRTDVRIADDVAEEVARLIGYDTLPSAPLAGPIPAPEPQPLRETIATVRDCLAGLGLCEVINYALTSEAAIARVQPLESITARPPLRTLNPLSLERTILRPTLRAGVLENYALNRRQRADAIGIFEVGRVFHARENDLPAERTLLTVLYGGEVQASFRRADRRTLDFFDAKAIAEALAAALRLPLDYSPGSDPALLAGHTAMLRVGDAAVGGLGRVHPTVCERCEIPDTLFLLELDIDLVTMLRQAGGTFTPPSRFPAVVEDLAFVVDHEVPAAAVERVLRRQRLVESVRLFDIYSGPPVPSGKKSLAFAVTYRAPDRTLTDAEIGRLRAGLVRQLADALGATLRDA